MSGAHMALNMYGCPFYSVAQKFIYNVFLKKKTAEKSPGEYDEDGRRAAAPMDKCSTYTTRTSPMEDGIQLSDT